MARDGSEIRLGPFNGGINRYADPTSIADNEMVDCQNFELTLQHELQSRPPIKTTTNMSGTTTERLVMLGVGIFSNVWYLFAGNTDGTFVYTGGVWTQLSSTFNSVACVQYVNKMYFLNQAGGAGISRTLAHWDPVGGFVIDNPANLNTMLPGYGGGAMVVFKERLWIVPGPSATSNASRLVFSDVGAPATFTATTQFIDVKPGDGTSLIDLCVYTESLMLFKEHSTHALQYNNTPGNTSIIEINNKIGASTKHCIAQFEGSVFVYHVGRVYEMNNNYALQRINVKCPFELDTSAPSTRAEDINLSIVGERLICRYFNKIYVYGLRTRTWSRWESLSDTLHNFGRMVRVPADELQAADEHYYAGSCISNDENVFLLQDGYSVGVTENDGADHNIECFIITKNYDVNTPHKIKKLYWWGADVVTVDSVVGTANPISYVFFVSWGMLYNQGVLAKNLQTWSTPLTTAYVQSTAIPALSSLDEVFVKFGNTLRFRKINFKIDFTTSGSTADGPVKLFTITMRTNLKMTVSPAVS